MSNHRIIPIVKECEKRDGVLQLKPYICTEHEDWQTLIKPFCQYTKKLYSVGFEENCGGIELIYDEMLEEESYCVDIDSEVKVIASDYRGCTYGLATILQLMNKRMELGRLKIYDKPDLDYRGLMVDLARKWHPFSTLIHYVDICFCYKVKYLHLHFMDNQSYTLPSKLFPKLPLEGRSYTREEIDYLCNYASERGIILVPEIEMPGHAKSLNEAYPELFANENDDNMTTVCAGNEKVFARLTSLIDEVLEMFPDSPYLHLGGDEVKTEGWKNCPWCIKYMHEHGINDLQELYAEFVARATNYVLSKGKIPIVWEGFPKEYADKISRDVIVVAWESLYHLPDDLVEEGFRIINASWKPLYIVPGHVLGMQEFCGGDIRWNELDIMKWNVYQWGNWLEKSASFLNPIHLTPTDQVIGGQLCVWETSYECEISLVVVRLAALSERTWCIRRCRDDKTFHESLKEQVRKAFQLIAEK